eukprot:RCo008205
MSLFDGLPPPQQGGGTTKPTSTDAVPSSSSPSSASSTSGLFAGLPPSKTTSTAVSDSAVASDAALSLKPSATAARKVVPPRALKNPAPSHPAPAAAPLKRPRTDTVAEGDAEPSSAGEGAKTEGETARGSAVAEAEGPVLERFQLHSAFAHEKGRRITMEDAAVTVDDLHEWIRLVVPLGGPGSAVAAQTMGPGVTADDLIDANFLSGTSRKAAMGFAKALRGIRETFFGAHGTCPAVPRMSYYAIYDGHGGRRAADFCKKWLHAYIYFELWKLIFDHVDGPSVAAAPDPSELFRAIPPAEMERALASACSKCDTAFLEDAIPGRWMDGCTVVAGVVVGSKW